MQRAGLELMDMMAVYQEGAYERLCRFVICFSPRRLVGRKLIVFGFSMNS